MTTVIFAFVAMLTLTAAMAVGVIFGRKPIAGTCGGMKALGMEMDCEIEIGIRKKNVQNLLDTFESLYEIKLTEI